MAMLCAEYASCCGGPGEPTCCSHLVTERVLSPSDEPPRVQAEWKSPQCKFELRPIVARPKVIRVVEYVFPAGQSTCTTACIAMEWAYAVLVMLCKIYVCISVCCAFRVGSPVGDSGSTFSCGG